MSVNGILYLLDVKLCFHDWCTEGTLKERKWDYVGSLKGEPPFEHMDIEQLKWWVSPPIYRRRRELRKQNYLMWQLCFATFHTAHLAMQLLWDTSSLSGACGSVQPPIEVVLVSFSLSLNNLSNESTHDLIGFLHKRIF